MKARAVPLLIGVTLAAACASVTPSAVTITSATMSDLSRSADILELEVPTPNAFPHDPAIGADEALWFTEQKANAIGRLDPVTGTFRESVLGVPDSGPHGIVADAYGAIWFTANAKGYVGELDPSTGRVIQYPMPDPHAKDPHTPVFAPDGTLWFTLEEANSVGRLDPATGHVTLALVPTAHAEPYGIAIGNDGAPYFCEFGANHIGRIDPRTMAIREYTLPVGARPRRISLAKDGTLYYSDFARGKLGRLDPTTGRVREWASPGGADSRPYAIAITPNDAVWFVETGRDPNVLVRFDPTEEAFAKMAIPSGGGTVRNMVATHDGRLFMACSGVNHVAIVSPRLRVAR